MNVIVSNAFNDDHPAIVRCKRIGLSIHRYHHFLGDLIRGYTSVAITGTHGKTTTTGMMSHVFGSIEPICSLIGDGTGKGETDARFFIFESCEYRRHFLAYNPDIAVITNIDFDHPDYFANIDDVRRAFEEMATLVGQLVVCGDDVQVRLLRTNKKMLFYGFGDHNELKASNLKTEDNGTSFEVILGNHQFGRFKIPLFGRHNVLNALAVIGVALVLELYIDDIRDHLKTFPGVKRRFTEKKWKSNIIIDDYAHHPSEIRATLEAVRSKYPDKKVVGVFQPHTFSRLEKFLDDFALSLSEADDVFLCQVFSSAREKSGNVTVDLLCDRIPNSKIILDNEVTDLLSYEDSVLVFMGAGDIYKYQNILGAYDKQ
jgi:UDP-N-acetylmuramate--alanine ligase